MELNLPPDEKTKVEVAESNLLTLRVAPDGTIYQSIGSDIPKKIDLKDLHQSLMDKNRSNPKLITLVKVDREGTYNMMVDLMDELNLANITRFSIAPLVDADKALIKKAS